MTNGNGNNGGLTLTPAGGDSVSAAASNLLQQIASSSGTVSSIQITLNFDQPAQPAQQPVVGSNQNSSTGTWVRQFDTANNQVVIIWVPDNPQKNTVQNILPANDPNKITWGNLLDNPPGIDIDAGMCLLRVENDGSGVIRWLPDDTVNQQPVQKTFQPVSATPSGGLGTDLAAYHACMTARPPAENFAQKFTHCLPQLFVPAP